MNFWPGLEEKLVADMGPRGTRLAQRAARSIAYALILVPYVMVAGAVAAVLFALQGSIETMLGSDYYGRLGFVLVATLIVVVGSYGGLYVAALVLRSKMFKDLERRRREHGEHVKEHNDDPKYRHIVITTPLDAREARDEIYDILMNLHIEAVTNWHREREEMKQGESEGQRQQALQEQSPRERDG